MDFIDEQIARLKLKHNDPAYVAPNLQEVIPQEDEDNEQGLGTWLGAAGIGAGNMLNNTLLGGGGQIFGTLGDLVERFSPFSGSNANKRLELMRLGIPHQLAQQIQPDQDSWLTSLGKASLELNNSIGDTLADWRKDVVGDNPSYGTQVAEGVGSSLGFMGAGILGTAFTGNPLVGALLSGGIEALSESGGTAADAYRQGLYDNGGLAAANKSFITNALLNSGLNATMGMFSPWMSRIRNPITRYATQTAGEVLNELIQEPSQQTIEKSAQQSLHNGGNFVSALGQNIPDWWDTAKELAPTVAASSAITSLLKAGFDMSFAKNRQQVASQFKHRNENTQLAEQRLKQHYDAVETLKKRLEAEKSGKNNPQTIDSLNKRIEKRMRQIKRLTDTFSLYDFEYTPDNEQNQNVTEQSQLVQQSQQNIGTQTPQNLNTNKAPRVTALNEAYYANDPYSDYGGDNSAAWDDIPETHLPDYSQAVSQKQNQNLTPLSFEEFNAAQSKQNFDIQSTLRAIAENSSRNLKPKVSKVDTNIAAPDIVRFSPPTKPNVKNNLDSVKDILTPHSKNNQDVANSPKGNITSVTAGDNDYSVQYRVIDVRKLITSHNLRGGRNQNFDQKLQGRKRENLASINWIKNTADNLKPQLLTANPIASYGAPIIGSDGMVESGNGRTLALLLAYSQHSADNYKQYITEHAHEFGLNPDDIAAIEQPVLVRERLTDTNRHKFAEDANKSSTATFDKTSRAIRDADKITSDVLVKFDPNRDIEHQHDFIWAFARNAVDQAEMPDFIQASESGQDVKLSQSGLDRIKNALFAKAYNDTDILQRLNEVIDDDIKNISNALIEAAPKIALLQHGINLSQQGSLDGYDEKLSIAQDIKQAALLVNEAKKQKQNEKDPTRRKKTLIDFVNAEVDQITFDKTYSPETIALARFFANNIRSAKRIATALNSYADSAMRYGTARDVSLFGEQQKKSRLELLQDAFTYAESNSTMDLFSEQQQGANLIHNRQIDDAKRDIKQGKKSPDYSESTNPGDLSLYPSPNNRQLNGWDTLGLRDNQQEYISDVPNIADISGLQQQYGNQQETDIDERNSPNLTDTQGRGNLGSDIGNRSQVTNQRGQQQLSSEQNNEQENPFSVPQYADISGLIEQEQNNDDDTDNAKIPVNRGKNDIQQDSNIQQAQKQQHNSAQNTGQFQNSDSDTKDSDYMPPEIIRDKEGSITVKGRNIQRSYVPSEAQQIKKAALTGKPMTRYLFASKSQQDGEQAPTRNNPQKYSYDAKLTGYDGYLGDISVGIGENESVSHAFFGEQDGQQYVGFTNPDGEFVATYDMRNNTFFINEGYENSAFARRIQDDFKRAFGKNPVEEILRRLVMNKAINAGELDARADAASRIYMEQNKYLAQQSGISLLDSVLADDLSIQKINRVGDKNDRGNTAIIPKRDSNGNPLVEAQNIVTLFKNSDASSLIHEFWHMYQEKIKRLGNAGLIKEGTRLFDDWKTIRSEAGMLQTNFRQDLSQQDNAKWKNSQEKNAASFEKYLREGNPPQGISQKLQEVFKNFKEWLGNVYHKITDIFYTDANGRRRNVPRINDDIRKVFDHIFGDKKKLNINGNTLQLQHNSAHNYTQAIQQFRQSGLNPQGWFSNLIGRAKNWAASLFSIAHKPHNQSRLDTMFPTQEIERRFTEASKPTSKMATLARVKHAFLSGIKNVAAGDYAEIARSPDANVRKARNLFRQLERAKKSVIAEGMKTFTENLKGLNPQQLDLFNRARVIQDLMFRIEKVPGAALSFGLSEQQVRDMHKKLMPLVENDEAVKNAIHKEEQTQQQIAQDFINAARLLGYDMSGLFSNPHYYRHRIIDYMDAIRAGRRFDTSTGNFDVQDTADSMLREAFGRGYFKRYKGTTRDYVTDYVQANSEVRVQMLQDIETLKALYKLKQEYDIAPRLQKQFGKQDSSQQNQAQDGSQSFSQSGDNQQLSFPFEHVPEGYTALDPTLIGLTESDKSAHENMLDNAVREFSQKYGIPIDTLLEQGLAVEDNIMVIPNEIAETLRKMAKSRKRGALGLAAKKLTTWWKQSVLFTPTRNLLYNIRNFTGDLDALIAGNPHALKQLPQAVKELTGWYTQHGKEGYEASQDLQDYIRLSGNLGIQSLNLTREDAQAILDLMPTPEKTKSGKTFPKRAQKEAERISRAEARMQEAQDTQEAQEPGKLRKAAGLPFKAIRKFFKTEHEFTEWREHLLRFAAYLDYKQQMETNKDGKPNNWGASIEEEVMSIDDIKERAFKMSNELLGAYDQVSEMGRQLRDVLIPFYSWMEVNMRRTYRLLKNGFKYGYGARQAKQLALGKAASMPFYALSAAESVTKLMLLTGAMQMFNRFVFPDADDELPNDVKYRPHLTFGNHNGRTYYFDRLGAIADAADWASLDSFVLDAKDFANGQQTLGGYLQKMIKAPFSKIINGLNPAIKMPIELAMGRSMFPDAFNPSTIRDPAEYVARSFGLVWPYRAFTGKPHDWKQELSKMFVYSQDADEAAYWQTLDRVRQFQNQVLDKHFDGFASTRRGRILQNIKKALRYKDGEAVRRFIREYHQADGTKQGLKQSMKAMDPLHGLSEKEKAQFMKWISADDRKYLRKAERYFHQLADRFIR